MLQLCGFSVSNYYNKVKLALLEKGVAFEEELVWLGETDIGASPLSKVPYLRTAAGVLSESSAMLEYIEAAHPATPLLPTDPLAAAKVRELCIYLDLHLELVARNLYPQAFFGGKVSDALRDRSMEQLDKSAQALGQLARWSPFIAGEQFTLADCCAIVHLPLVSAASKLVGGRDVLADLPVRDYLARMGERAAVQRVQADRKAATAVMMERMRR